MLDFDQLADARAMALSQPKESWRKAVWSSGFQKLTQNMSDGEVEQLIALCPTVGHMEWMVKFLEERFLATGTAPFSLLKAEATKSGTSLEEWIRQCFTSGLPK